MKEIVWSREAAHDLENIKKHIAYDSPSYADIYVEKIFDAVERLTLHPLSGRIVPEFNDTHIREIFYGNYRIIYSLIDSVVRIYAVVHGSRDLRDFDDPEKIN